MHESPTLWNLLDSTDSRYADDSYAEKIAASGVTAINHTVAATDGLHSAMKSISVWQKFYRDQPALMQATTASCVEQAKKSGQTAMFMGFQGIEPLEGDLDLLGVYHALGLRFLQVTYQRRNLAGEGCGEPTANSVGLSKFGRDLVRECNALGIVLDISHVGSRTSLDVIELSEHPVVASHSAARGLVECVRNKTDDELRALADHGGMIGIAGKSLFLNAGGATQGSDMSDYVRHLEYVANLVGIDHVGIGTDVSDNRRYSPALLRQFRETYPELPLGGPNDDPSIINTRELSSPADLPVIARSIATMGLTEEEQAKVLGLNAQRVVSAVLPG